ncbi:MAG: DUF6659 family protein [Nitrosopumilaceae archaeon]
MDAEKVCDEIRKLDSRMRFVGIINNKGRLIAGGMKEGIKPLEDTKKDEMLFMELALRVRMRREFDKELGPVKFSMSYRDIIIMSFPLDEDALFVTAEREIDFYKIPFEILKIIGK